MTALSPPTRAHEADDVISLIKDRLSRFANLEYEKLQPGRAMNRVDTARHFLPGLLIASPHCGRIRARLFLAARGIEMLRSCYAVCLILVLMNPGALFAQDMWLVVNRDGTIAFSKADLSGEEVGNLPFGAIVEPTRKDMAGGAISVEVAFSTYGNEATGYVERSQIAGCFPSKKLKRSRVKRLQQDLRAVFRAEAYTLPENFKADGVLGPQTRGLIEQFLGRYTLSLDNVGADCAATLASQWTLQQRQKRRREIARRVFESGDCEKLRRRYSEFLDEFPLELCLELKEQKDRERQFFAALESDKCAEAQELARDMTGKENELDQCYERQHKQQLRVSMGREIATGNCDKARAIADDLGEGEADVDRCYADAERKRNLALLRQAIGEGACDEVERLEALTGKTGGLVRCKFNVAMTATSARKMFLAAAQYDAGDDRARARLLYTELVNRFPEDDLALQAVMRLTALRDLERTEQAKAEMEAEMRRLQREAEDAQRAAEAAQRRAESAQAEAARNAQARASAQQANNDCAGLYRNYRFRNPVRIPDNPTVVDSIGMLMGAGTGYYEVLRVDGFGNGIATVVNDSNGRSWQMYCRDIP